MLGQVYRGKNFMGKNYMRKIRQIFNSGECISNLKLCWQIVIPSLCFDCRIDEVSYVLAMNWKKLTADFLVSATLSLDLVGGRSCFHR